MRLRKYISLFLAIVITIGCTIRSYAMEIGTGNMEVVVEDKEKNEEIDRLFSLRCELELEYEQNAVLISEIDRQLAILGVEEMTAVELASKIGFDVMPCVSANSTSTTQWTSRRVVVTYYGKQYELQIVEGVPTSGSSPLRRNYLNVSYEAEGIIAGTTDAIKVIGISALGAVPVIGDTLSLGITAYDAFNAAVSGLSTSSTIDNVDGSATVSLTGHMKFVFVKTYGASDTGNQVLCYVGSEVSYLVTAVSVVDVMINNKLHTYHNISTSREDGSTSQYYTSYTVPAQNYYNYKTNGNSNFIYDYHITYVTLSLFGNSVRFAAPYEYANIS